MTTSRMSAVPLSPYRPKRETSGKLIFISCEGAVTEWEYFGEIVNSDLAMYGQKSELLMYLRML